MPTSTGGFIAPAEDKGPVGLFDESNEYSAVTLAEGLVQQYGNQIIGSDRLRRRPPSSFTDEVLDHYRDHIIAIFDGRNASHHKQIVGDPDQRLISVLIPLEVDVSGQRDVIVRAEPSGLGTWSFSEPDKREVFQQASMFLGDEIPGVRDLIIQVRSLEAVLDNEQNQEQEDESSTDDDSVDAGGDSA